MDCQNIIMNHSVPPSLEDLETFANAVMESLPEELANDCVDIVVCVEDMVDDVTMTDFELEDPFELVALYRSGKEIAPGIERKIANDDDILMIYRRALLDIWCETEEDIQTLIRQVIIEELGRYLELSDDDVQEMAAREYQGVL